MIHVARDGAKLGEFTLEQIRQGLTTGQFRSTDLGWQTGMADWRPLSEFVGATPTPTPTPAPGAASLDVSTTAGIPAAAGLPWENRHQLGFFKAFFDTVIMVLSRPGDAFSIMRPEGGLTDPLLFGLIGGSAGAIVSTLYQLVMRSVGFGQTNLFSKFGFGVSSFVIFDLILTPLKIAIGLFVFAAILHLCLMMFGGASRAFETTFRVVAYSAGATYLLCLIPICGGLATLIYLIVVCTIGLARAHQTTTGKALMAVLTPFIVCCGVATIFGVLVGGAVAEYLRHLH